MWGFRVGLLFEVSLTFYGSVYWHCFWIGSVGLGCFWVVFVLWSVLCVVKLL